MGIKTTQNNKEVVKASEVIILAVKPHMVVEVLREVQDELKSLKRLTVSIAAGITISQIEKVRWFTVL